MWFAVGTAVNVVIGRVPFALGLACGLVVIWALQRHHVPVAVAAAVVTALTSPVAAVCVVVAIVAWAAARRRWLIGGILGAAVMVPLLAAVVVFPDGGVFPYEPWAFATDVAIAAVVFLVAGRDRPAVRVGAVGFALVAAAAFVVPTALGGNISRFSQFVAGPVIACLLWPRRKVMLGALALPLLCWQWMPAVQTIAAGPEQLESSRAYYQPVVDYVLAQGPVPGRLEVLQTSRHWEAAYVADYVPLPRGWERQLDLTYNHVFYDGTLNAATYEQWLQDNAVQYVALPDAHLDDSSIQERQLLEQGLDYLVPVWQDAALAGVALHGLHGAGRRTGHRDPPGRGRLRPTCRRTRRGAAPRPTVAALEPVGPRLRGVVGGRMDPPREPAAGHRGADAAVERLGLPVLIGGLRHRRAFADETNNVAAVIHAQLGDEGQPPSS